MEVLRCLDEDDLREAVAWAVAEETPVRVLAGASKALLGRPVDAIKTLDIARLSGVRFYEPDELVLRAAASTPLREIDVLLAEQGQALAFEPRDLGPLLGAPAGRSTLGGIVATAQSGPRRVKAGGVRDHVLGMAVISGRGERFVSGGRVMKNVTGYDLPKLMTGAYGTLGVISEITLKVVPAGEDMRTVLMAGLDDRAAMVAMRDAMATPYEVSGAAHLPASVVHRSALGDLVRLGSSATVLRLEGWSASLEARVEGLLARLRRPGFYLGPLAERGGALVLDAAASRTLWTEIRDVRYFAGGTTPIWRVAVTPMNAPQVVEAVGADAWFYDWAGGLIWLDMGDAPRADEPLVRRALASSGGHATLIRAEAALRASLPVFEPQPPALAALTRRIKDGFDPARVLNRGLMYREL